MGPGFLRNTSIRIKVLALVMLVSAASLVLASGSLLLWDYVRFRGDIARELSTQAQMILQNSTAAMSFKDQAAARETLATLAPNPHIEIGCLYAPDESVFAEFRSGGDAIACPQTPPPDGSRFSPNRVEVVVRTKVAGRPAGGVYLASDLDALSSRVRVQAWTGAGVMVVVLVGALLLSSLLQRVISEPIEALLNTARDVSTRHDYSLRARKTTGGELGVLVDAFNSMLARIEHAQNERTDLLAREREANRLKDEFLMTLSHELRTPLNAIKGWTRMLISHVIPPAGVEKALQRIEHNAEAQARLVEDLLEVSRFTTGKFRLERLTFDLAAVANQAIETVRPEAESREVEIERDFNGGSQSFHGDPDRIQQVIWNLLSNAIKFSPRRSPVVVALRRAGDVVEIQVRDMGVGIAPSFLPLVFEPFRQADSSSTRAHGGLGLGLSIVRRIVELHDGTIEAASPGVGRGATFTVRLPVQERSRALAPPEHRVASRPTVDLEGASILIVDDDPDTREMLVTLLTAAGATVRQAASTVEALALAAATMPDVLITDIAMPGRDGYSLLQELRWVSRHPALLAIALTAQATTDDRDRALKAGFTRHVPKPFEPQRLVELVREVMATSSR